MGKTEDQHPIGTQGSERDRRKNVSTTNRARLHGNHVYSSHPDLKEEPFQDTDNWFSDGSSFVKQGVRMAGYVVTTTEQGWAYPPPGLRLEAGGYPGPEVLLFHGLQGDTYLPWIFTTGSQGIMAFESTPVFLWRSLPTGEQSLNRPLRHGSSMDPSLGSQHPTRAVLAPA
ncbi:hypothetical protein BTVI_44106 [Pitangus sulphuratus]|nr:hypothetical protein BTVI_44106 [Pitangus sulphuratus]